MTRIGEDAASKNRKIENPQWHDVHTKLINMNQFLFLFFCLVGGGVQLGSLGTAATDWPIVPARGDYDDGEFGGMKIGRGNRSTQRKPAPA
jgi:hypothetical protein